MHKGWMHVCLWKGGSNFWNVAALVNPEEISPQSPGLVRWHWAPEGHQPFSLMEKHGQQAIFSHLVRLILQLLLQVLLHFQFILQLADRVVLVIFIICSDIRVSIFCNPKDNYS